MEVPHDADPLCALSIFHAIELSDARACIWNPRRSVLVMVLIVQHSPNFAEAQLSYFPALSIRGMILGSDPGTCVLWSVFAWFWLQAL